MDKLVRGFGASLAALLFALAVASGPAAAQGERKAAPEASDPSRTSPGRDSPAVETDAPRAVPGLELSPAQRDAIYQSISNRQTKKDTAPVGFRAAVGAHVPDSIKLEPLPKAVVELVPKAVDYEYAFVANQVLIVEPRSRTVVEVIH